MAVFGIGVPELIICGFPALIVGVIMLVAKGSKGGSPAAAPPVAAAGWLPDPTGRHELRYWNGKLWTSAVSDQGVQSDDPM